MGTRQCDIWRETQRHHQSTLIFYLILIGTLAVTHGVPTIPGVATIPGTTVVTTVTTAEAPRPTHGEAAGATHGAMILKTAMTLAVGVTSSAGANAVIQAQISSSHSKNFWNISNILTHVQLH